MKTQVMKKVWNMSFHGLLGCQRAVWYEKVHHSRIFQSYSSCMLLYCCYQLEKCDFSSMFSNIQYKMRQSEPGVSLKAVGVFFVCFFWHAVKLSIPLCTCFLLLCLDCRWKHLSLLQENLKIILVMEKVNTADANGWGRGGGRGVPVKSCDVV